MTAETPEAAAGPVRGPEPPWAHMVREKGVREKGLWLLVGIGVAFFARPLIFGETFFFRDLQLIFLPKKLAMIELLRSGQLPFWNPYLHGGSPLLADLQNAGFYPTNLLYLILPVTRALTLEVVLHVLLSAAAAYLLARVLGLTQPAAFLSGAIYGYCGYTLSKVNIYFHLLATPHLPLALLAWHLYLREGRRRWFLLAIVAGTLQAFAGSPEVAVLTFATLAAWTLIASQSRLSLRARCGRYLVLGFGVAGLAAVQLVPTLELVLESERGAGFHQAVVSKWSLPWRRLPELVVPGFLGSTDTVGAGDYWGRRIVDSGTPLMLSVYFGLVPFALALVGAGYREFLNRRFRALLGVLVTLSLVLALGRFLPFYDLLYRGLPPIQFFRYPIKFLNLGVLPLALLAGAGLDRLFQGRSVRYLRIGWGLTVALGVVVLGWRLMPGLAVGFQEIFFELSSPKAEARLAQAFLQTLGVWLILALALQSVRLQAAALERPRPALSWLVASVVLVDLLAAGWRLNPTAPPELITAVPPAVATVREQIGGGRFYRSPIAATRAVSLPSNQIAWMSRWNREVLNSSLATGYRIPVIFNDDIDSLAPRRLTRIKNAAEQASWPRRLALLSAGSVELLMADAEIEGDLEELGVELVAVVGAGAGSRSFVYRNRKAAARIEFAGAVYPAPSEEDAMGAMLGPGFDPRQHVVLEGASDRSLPPGGCRGAEEIRVLEGSVHRQRLAVRSECPGALVFSEPSYPGWRVWVDEQPAEVLRANVGFQAIWLEAGEHTVERRYVPRIFRIGLVISLGMLTFFGALAIFGRRWLGGGADLAATPPPRDGGAAT